MRSGAAGGDAAVFRLRRRHTAPAAGDRPARAGNLLIKEDFDRAIRALERAVGVNPTDGPGYFYLAEAWLGKQNFEMAARFNGLACLYLRDDPAWSKRAKQQKARIGQGLAGP